MKKIIFSLLAVATLASCAKTEAVYVENTSEIKIMPATAIATKANYLGAIDEVTYPVTENFDVYGYWSADWANETNPTTYLLTDGESGVEFVNKGRYWGGATPYHWPKDGSLQFAAYSPSSVDLAHTWATDTYSKEAYIQPFETSKTWDLLLAQTSAPYTAHTAAENVSVVFNHALSWITLKVVAKDATAAQAFDIKKVTINNVMTQANLSAAMTDEGVPANAWSAWAEPKDMVVYTGSQDVTEELAVIETTPMGTLVIPQATTQVTLNYTQKAFGGTAELENQTIVLDLALDTDESVWVPGKHYTYTLVFGLDEILINPTVTLWDEVNVGDLEAGNNTHNVSTEAQLFAAIAKGGEVVLQENITVSTTVNVDKDVILDLNGKTLSNKLDNTVTDVIVVKPTGNLTINGEGTIEAVSGNDGYAVISEGLLIINNGTFKAGVDENGEPNAVIYARGEGKVFVCGGFFPNENNSTYVLNKKDADRETTTILVYAGTFYKFNPCDNAAENPGTNFCAEGYVAYADGDYYIVVNGAIVRNADEFKAAAANAAIKYMIVAADLDFGTSFTVVNTDKIIMGNGYKFKGGGRTTKNYALGVQEPVKVVINDLVMNGGGGIYVSGGADVEVNNVDLSVKYSGSGRHLFYVSNAVLTVNSGEYEVLNTGCAYFSMENKAVAYVKGGTWADMHSERKPVDLYTGAKLQIEGGKFQVDVPKYKFDPTPYLATGYKAERVGNYMVVSAK